MKRFIPVLLVIVACGARAAPSLVVLDVGEGQAILLQEESRGILIDTGHPGMASHLLKRLTALGVERLDYLILTHLHPDHAGGYFRLREQFPDTPLLYTGHPLPVDVRPDLIRWTHQAIAADRHWRRFLAGDRIHWRGMVIEALWPASFENHNLNRHSLVLSVHYRGLKLLLMGDADHEVEKALLEQKRLPREVDLLVAGHHGAADATGEAFLAAVRPRFTVISVNEENIRGYPSPEVIARLEQSGTRLLRTDRDGELRFRLHCEEGDDEPRSDQRSCSILFSPENGEDGIAVAN